jgi:uncharacterized membrane protein
MKLAPLLEAAPAIQFHAVAALGAFALLQFAAPKGTIPHRTVGWIFTLAMLPLAVWHARRHAVAVTARR